MAGRPNPPLTGNPISDASAIIATYEADGKLSDRELRVLVEATRQLVADHTAVTRAMARVESVWPTIRDGLNEIHAVTTARLGRRPRSRHWHRAGPATRLPRNAPDGSGWVMRRGLAGACR